MEIENSVSSSSFPVIGNWTLIKVLGTGATSKVFLGVDQSTGKEAAVKIFNPDNQYALTIMQAEAKMLKEAEHQNVLSFIDSFDEVEFYNPSTGESAFVSALVMEYAAKGELFELLGEKTYFSEETAQKFFQQLIESIEHLHSRNIAHRDIKLENILLDSRLNIKLADLGYSTYFDSKKLYKIPAGTSTYFSPEIHAKLPFSVEKADLFAAAIVLFTLVAGHMPFANATKDDQVYRLLIENRKGDFWKFHTRMMKRKDENFEFSNEFKDLMDKMFAANPRHRLNLQEIICHPWVGLQL